MIAPSLIPKKAGDHIKTDKLDALNLAKLLKSEDLTPIYVPEPENEAMQDLSRARETAMKDLKDAKYQLKALLLRNNINATVKDNWSSMHLRWLAELILPSPKMKLDLANKIQQHAYGQRKEVDRELLGSNNLFQRIFTVLCAHQRAKQKH